MVGVWSVEETAKWSRRDRGYQATKEAGFPEMRLGIILVLFILHVRGDDECLPFGTGCEEFCDQNMKACLPNLIWTEISHMYIENSELQ